MNIDVNVFCLMQGQGKRELLNCENNICGFGWQLDEFRAEITRRDQEILAMSAKMKTLEEQHQDYQRHIAVLKESLCAKEEHYNMLQADVSQHDTFWQRGMMLVFERSNFPPFSFHLLSPSRLEQGTLT